MFKVDALGSHFHGFLSACQLVFYRASEEEINANMDNSDDHVEDETRDDEEVERFTNENGGIEPGKRSSRWFDRVEKTIQDNRKRSVQNRNLLERVDMRTVWIARILVALLATVVGGLILQILI